MLRSGLQVKVVDIDEISKDGFEPTGIEELFINPVDKTLILNGTDIGLLIAIPSS